jgi:hypothetical protein
MMDFAGRRPRRAAVAGVTLCLLGLSACGTSASVTTPLSPPATRSTPVSPTPRAAPGVGSPPKTIIARALRPAATDGLPRGSRVPPSFSAIRVFANAQDGFAVPDLPQKGLGGPGSYPVMTSNGGRSWRTACPVLHSPAAQGAIAVGQPGMVGARILFAWCGSCNSVIDTSSDAGRHWWQTFLPGQVLSVLGGSSARDGLEAVVEGPTTNPDGRGASLWTYFSTDGRRWKFRYSMNATA